MSATKATKSSNLFGLRLLAMDCATLLSNWNTPVILPCENKSNVGSSSKGILSISKSLSPISSIALSIMDKFRRPRKSIFNKPSCSTVCISYCVTSSAPSPFCCTGKKFVILSGEITTAAAWIPSCLRSPSRPSAISIIFLTSSLSLYCFLSSEEAE